MVTTSQKTTVLAMANLEEPSKLSEDQINAFKLEFDLNREQILELDVIFKASAILLLNSETSNIPFEMAVFSKLGSQLRLSF